MRRVAFSVLLGFTLCAAAHATEPIAKPAADAEPFMRGLVQPADVALVLSYLRDALAAAAEGREAPAPDELTRRAEAIAEDLKRRGVVTGRALVDALERMLGERERATPRLPPSSPLQRI